MDYVKNHTQSTNKGLLRSRVMVYEDVRYLELPFTRPIQHGCALEQTGCKLRYIILCHVLFHIWCI